MGCGTAKDNNSLKYEGEVRNPLRRNTDDLIDPRWNRHFEWTVGCRPAGTSTAVEGKALSPARQDVSTRRGLAPHSAPPVDA